MWLVDVSHFELEHRGENKICKHFHRQGLIPQAARVNFGSVAKGVLTRYNQALNELPRDLQLGRKNSEKRQNVNGFLTEEIPRQHCWNNQHSRSILGYNICLSWMLATVA